MKNKGRIVLRLCGRVLYAVAYLCFAIMMLAAWVAAPAILWLLAWRDYDRSRRKSVVKKDRYSSGKRKNRYVLKGEDKHGPYKEWHENGKRSIAG